MSSYTWDTYPAHGTSNFEVVARAALETWRSNGAGMEVRLNEIEDGSFFAGLTSPIIPSSAIVSLDPDLFADRSIPENKLDIEGTVSDGAIAVWRDAAGGRVYESVEGVVGGDTYQVKLNATGSANYLESYIASEDDMLNDATDKLVTPNSLKSALSSALPVGMVFPWVGGYFTNGVNGGFTAVLSANSVSAVNELFNNQGLYVCDGAELRIPGSLCFDGGGRYLPNLTDSRFLMGSTVAGVVGGANTMAHTHAGGSHRLTISEMPSHSHSISVSSNGAHSHGFGAGFCSANGNNSNIWGSGCSRDGTHYTDSAGNHTHSASASSIGSNGYHSHGTTSGASNTENRPQYFTCFFMIKVW